MLLLVAFLLFVGAIAVVGAAFAKEQPSGLARALEALERSGHAGGELVQEVDRPFAERVLAPVQARALALGRRLAGADKADRIRRRLDVAGNPRGWTVDRVLSLKVIGAVTLPVLVIAYSALIGGSVPVVLVIAAASGAIGFVGPDLYLYNKRSEEHTSELQSH